MNEEIPEKQKVIVLCIGIAVIVAFILTLATRIA
jgi:hypothetical protein